MNVVSDRLIWLGVMSLLLLLNGCAGLNDSQNHEDKSRELEALAIKQYQANQFKESADTYKSAIDEFNAAEHACQVGMDCIWDAGQAHKTGRILYSRAGWAKYRAGDRDGAIKDVEYSVNEYPDVDYPASWYLLGILYNDAGRQADALRAYEELKKQDVKLANKLQAWLEKTGSVH